MQLKSNPIFAAWLSTAVDTVGALLVILEVGSVVADVVVDESPPPPQAAARIIALIALIEFRRTCLPQAPKH